MEGWKQLACSRALPVVPAQAGTHSQSGAAFNLKIDPRLRGGDRWVGVSRACGGFILAFMHECSVYAYALRLVSCLRIKLAQYLCHAAYDQLHTVVYLTLGTTACLTLRIVACLTLRTAACPRYPGIEALNANGIVSGRG